MRLAMLSPITRRTPPRRDGPVETIVSLLTEGLVAAGVDVTLFATADSQTSGSLRSVAPGPLEEDKASDPAVLESLHISALFEDASRFDLIHNHMGHLPLCNAGLTETPVITTIHGSLYRQALPVYQKYDGKVYYVSTSDADRAPELTYIATIRNGVDITSYDLNERGGSDLLYFGDIHPDNGTREAVETALRAEMGLVIVGGILDEAYYKAEIEPRLSNDRIRIIEDVGLAKRRELLGSSAALLWPSRLGRPFDLAPIEANACGTPIIAFLRGPATEIVRHEVNGFVVSDVFEAAEAARRLGELSRLACRKTVEERFSQYGMVEDYLNLYQLILQETKREDRRPWGYYEVLSHQPDHKVKRIVVFPGKRLSLQQHGKRAEFWTIISGEPVVFLGDREIRLKPGDSILVPKEVLHRVSNPGDDSVVFIEVQIGDYLGEDDIERFEDDYGRVDLNFDEGGKSSGPTAGAE